MSRLADELCADGLTRRMSHPTDRRSVLLELTPLGTNRATRLVTVRQALFNGLLDRPTKEDRPVVLAGLDRLARAAHET